MKKPRRQINPQIIFWTVFCLLLIVWTFVQFHQFGQALNLNHDFAQYAFAMFDWRNAGQFPLLGPFSGMVNFNLSPLYYWIIYPFYLITNGSVFYNHIACFVYTSITFFALALLLHKRPAYRWSYLFLMALICLNPRIQSNVNDMVWNPSYTWQPIIVTWYCLVLAPQSKHRTLLNIISGVACAISISLNLSMVPIAIGLLVVNTLRLRKNIWPWLAGFFAVLLICWLPVFTVQLDRIYHQGLILPNKHPEALTVSLRKLTTYPFIDWYSYSNYDQYIIQALIVTIIILSLKKISGKKLLHQDWFQLLLVLIISTVITLIPGTTLHAHYVIGFTILIILLFANSPSRLKYLIGVLLLTFWLAIYLKKLTVPQQASVLGIEACFAQACQQVVPYQYNYTEYTSIITSDAYSYFLTIAGCPPAQRWGSFYLNSPEYLTETDYPLLVFHNLDGSSSDPTWLKVNIDPFYVELKSVLDEVYTNPIASASCDDNWGWTLYGKLE